MTRSSEAFVNPVKGEEGLRPAESSNMPGSPRWKLMA